MIQSAIATFGIVIAAGIVFVLIGGDEPAITAAHERQAFERKNDLRPCDGLYVRHSGTRFRGAPQCVPSADLTERRPLPAHILTSPL